jgi:hypothetical protein
MESIQGQENEPERDTRGSLRGLSLESGSES